MQSVRDNFRNARGVFRQLDDKEQSGRFSLRDTGGNDRNRMEKDVPVRGLAGRAFLPSCVSRPGDSALSGDEREGGFRTGNSHKNQREGRRLQGPCRNPGQYRREKGETPVIRHRSHRRRDHAVLFPAGNRNKCGALLCPENIRGPRGER